MAKSARRKSASGHYLGSCYEAARWPQPLDPDVARQRRWISLALVLALVMGAIAWVLR